MSDSRWNPGDPRNKDWTRTRQRELRQVLLRWDPIGVAGVPEAEDEYDCLISPLMHQLYEGADEVAVKRWVMTEMEEHFGMEADDQRDGALATEVVAWWRDATIR